MLNHWFNNPRILKIHPLLLAGLIFIYLFVIALIYEFWLENLIHDNLFFEDTYYNSLTHILLYISLAATGAIFPFWLFSLYISAVRDAESKPLYVVAQTQNITDRKRVENELRRTNRMLKMLNDCSEAMVRSRYEWELLDFICENIVRLGGYRMAWVGYAENDEEKTVRPVAQSGIRAVEAGGGKKRIHFLYLYSLKFGSEYHRRPEYLFA